ncbi:MAG TPA: hypothetical protein GXX50_06940 [Firmicutes bacterium]|nr:hypothetical protein [Bacillota bacterium]
MIRPVEILTDDRTRLVTCDCCLGNGKPMIILDRINICRDCFAEAFQEAIGNPEFFGKLTASLKKQLQQAIGDEVGAAVIGLPDKLATEITKVVFEALTPKK